MRLYNTLTRTIEEFKPLQEKQVTFYGCGPTVYDKQHIGNYRSILLYDLISRILKYLGYTVNNVMNYTDVGHLRMTDLQKAQAEKKLNRLEDTDAEVGDDKLERQAKKEGLTPFQIADKYIQMTEDDLKLLNFAFPQKVIRATQYINEQIALIKKLEEKGYAYVTPEAVYFDVNKYNADHKNSYFELVGDQLDKQFISVRNEVVEDKSKRNAMDFRLWQLNQPHHAMQWESPWGRGFPGWHIECSAMALSNLGETIDIHAGGSNLIFPHHTNEIAQSQAATAKPFVHYWVHGANLTIYDTKMGKSLGNAYTLTDIAQKGYHPLALRYLYFQTHYRKPMSFSWEALQGAQEAYMKLKEYALTLKKQTQRTMLSEEKLEQVDSYRQKFTEAVANDFQMPQAVSVVWEMLKSNIPSADKLDLLYEFDEVLGLRLREVEEEQIPEEIITLAQKRLEYKNNRDFTQADELRRQIETKGYTIEDSGDSFTLKKTP